MTHKWGFFAIATQLGGAERSLLDLLGPLAQLDSTPIKVVVSKDKGPLVEALRRRGFAVDVLPFPALLLGVSRQRPLKALLLSPVLFCQWLWFMVKLVRYLKREKFTRIHTTGLKFHFCLGCLAPFFDFQLVVHLRDIVGRTWLRQFFVWLSHQKGVQLVANSQATADSVAPAKTILVYNGFDISRLHPDHRPYLQKMFGWPEDAVVVGMVGAIARWKGQREFVTMALHLRRLYPRAYFVLIGSEIYDTDGEKGELAKLRLMAEEGQARDRIFFLEFQPEIERIYNSLDVLVHCSIAPEPFGRVIVEAMLCGVCVVAANAGGPSEIIRHGENGLLYELGSLQAMTESVERVLSDHDLRLKLQQNAPSIQSQFSLKAYVNEMHRILTVNVLD